MDNWDRVLYLFYWSLPNSFDMVKMKGVKNMRRDPACLLSRVLYEISSTVSIMVSSSELRDFGVVKHGNKQIKKAKRAVRRVQLVIEETKENHIVCLQQATPHKKITTYSSTHRSNASDVFLFGGGCMTGWCQLYPKKAHVRMKRIRWTGSTKEELEKKIKELNKNYVITLDCNLPKSDQGIVFQAILPKEYAEYEQKIEELKKAKATEKESNKIKQAADGIMKNRYEEILQAFFNKYHTKQYCLAYHSEMCAIKQELGDDINGDIRLDAVAYASMERRNPSECLPEIEELRRFNSRECLSKITKDLKAKVGMHRKEISRIEKKKNADLNAADSFEQREKRRQGHSENEESEDEDQMYDISLNGEWYTGSIVMVDEPNNKVQIHYDGYLDADDEWITQAEIENRIAPLNTHTAPIESEKGNKEKSKRQKKKKKKKRKKAEDTVEFCEVYGKNGKCIGLD
eukprot:222791_1